MKYRRRQFGTGLNVEIIPPKSWFLRVKDVPWTEFFGKAESYVWQSANWRPTPDLQEVSIAEEPPIVFFVEPHGSSIPVGSHFYAARWYLQLRFMASGGLLRRLHKRPWRAIQAVVKSHLEEINYNLPRDPSITVPGAIEFLNLLSMMFPSKGPRRANQK